MICHNCGAESKDGAAFCTNCGSKMQQAPAYSPFAPAAPKQVKTGTVIGIVLGSIAVIIAIIVFSALFIVNRINTDLLNTGHYLRDPETSIIQQQSGIMATPAPVPPVLPVLPNAPPPFEPVPLPEPLPGLPVIIENNELEGSWSYISGDWIWFFGESELIAFFEYFDDDGIFGVYASEPDEFAFCFFTEDGSLIVETDDGFYFEFNWRIFGDDLILIDSDGDMLQLKRIND